MGSGGRVDEADRDDGRAPHQGRGRDPHRLYYTGHQCPVGFTAQSWLGGILRKVGWVRGKVQRSVKGFLKISPIF